MARSPGLPFAVIAVLGLSGCLLFTDPINKAPSVTFVDPPNKVYRGVAASFQVNVSDDHDAAATLQVRWGEFPASAGSACAQVSSSIWTALWTPESQPRSASLPYLLTAKDLDPICLCALVADQNQATTIACQLLTPVNPAPVIMDVSGLTSDKERRLCSQIHLSAESARYETDHQLGFAWTIQYADGPDPVKGGTVSLAPCSTMKDRSDHQCFVAMVPGTYLVSVTLSDTTPGTGLKSTSDPGTFAVHVGTDKPPCILQTSPEVDVGRIIISRGTEPGTGYESTFEVTSVDDDCESLPVVGSRLATHFLWSVRDPNGPAGWAYQNTTTKSFTINQAMFPAARAGDTIQLRVEARDSSVDKNGGATCKDSVAICCGADECVGRPPTGCVRWTTWTVQFQP